MGRKEITSKRVNSLLFHAYEVKYDAYEVKYGFATSVYAEIVKFEPNWYYHHKDEFMEDPTNTEFMVTKSDGYPMGRIHKSNFENKETCYTMATFEEKINGGGWDLKYCGDRPIRMLNEDEMQDFIALISFGYNFLEGADGIEEKSEE